MDSPPDNSNYKTLALLLISLSVVLAFSYVYLQTFSRFNLMEDEYLSLATAEALPLDISEDQLSAHEGEWMTVNFPFHWRNRFSINRAVWYRLTVSESTLFQLAESSGMATAPVWGIYLWRLNQTADIWLNGQKIGSGGSTSEPMARYWNTPLYFEFPASLLQAENRILVKHYAQHGWGSMEPLVIAPAEILQAEYERRYLIQHDIALGLFVFVLVTGVFSFSVWFYRRRESEYFWFAVASSGLSFYCLNQFIRYLPTNPDTWRWLSNVAIDLWAYAMVIFVLRSLNLKKKVVEKVGLIYLLAGVPLYGYASFWQVFDINIYYHAGSLLLGGYLFIVCIDLYRKQKQALPGFYCCVIMLVFVAGVHDTVMQAIVNNGWFDGRDSGFQNHFNSLHFAAPVIFMFIGASLIKRFIDSMNQVDSLNAELETRIGIAREELEENYRAIEQVLIRQSASEERERIYRDLHDDVGSKLLSLYYRLDNESDSTLAKSALEDLRDIVSRKSLDSCLLCDAVLQWEQEARDRVSDAGVKLEWNSSGLDETLMLSDLQHTQLRRMLREVLSNALLHSKNMTVIQVCIKTGESSLMIAVTNDGSPGQVSQWQAGRGISNLRIRARDLGGEFRMLDLEGDRVQVVWDIPAAKSGEAK